MVTLARVTPVTEDGERAFEDMVAPLLAEFSSHRPDDDTSTIVAAARAAHSQVIYVRVAFRTGTPEVSPRNLTFSAFAGSGSMSELDPATEVHPALAPQAGDVVVTKRRVSAFSGSRPT